MTQYANNCIQRKNSTTFRPESKLLAKKHALMCFKVDSLCNIFCSDDTIVEDLECIRAKLMLRKSSRIVTTRKGSTEEASNHSLIKTLKKAILGGGGS